MADARELAAELAEFAPLSAVGHKRALNLMNETQRLSPTAKAEIEELEAAAFASFDLQEGLAAFMEKRTPRFRGH